MYAYSMSPFPFYLHVCSNKSSSTCKSCVYMVNVHVMYMYVLNRCNVHVCIVQIEWILRSLVYVYMYKLHVATCTCILVQ